MLVLNFNVRANAFSEQTLAENLNISQYSQVQPLSEKIRLGSSIFVEQRDELHDFLRLRLKEDFDLTEKPFLDFLLEAYEAWPKQ